MEYDKMLTRLKQTCKTRHEQKHKRKEKRLALEDSPSPTLDTKLWKPFRKQRKTPIKLQTFPQVSRVKLKKGAHFQGMFPGGEPRRRLPQIK